MKARCVLTVAAVALFACLGVTAAAESDLLIDGSRPLPQLPGEAQMRALAQAYPDRISIAVRGGEWAAFVDDAWFYWAEGRMLPEQKRFLAVDFTPFRFYEDYRRGPPTVQTIDDAMAEQLAERSRATVGENRPRYPGFSDALYGIGSRADADGIMQRVYFLDRWTVVHPMIVEPLTRVRAEVQALMAEDGEVAEFGANLVQFSGYFWRNIAGTQSRSYHSYGVAVDLIPHSYGGRYGYWQWAYDGGVDQWWALPQGARWMPPQPVIDAFERNGFVWGGKWLFFDPLHFEYRPETLLLADKKTRIGFSMLLTGEPNELE